MRVVAFGKCPSPSSLEYTHRNVNVQYFKPIRFCWGFWALGHWPRTLGRQGGCKVKFARLHPHDNHSIILLSCHTGQTPLNEHITSLQRLAVAECTHRSQQRSAGFLSKAHVIPVTHIISDVPSCACFCNACCGLHLNSKCFFPLSYFYFLLPFPLWLLLQ